jgi:hypothetical protein
MPGCAIPEKQHLFIFVDILKAFKNRNRISGGLSVKDPEVAFTGFEICYAVEALLLFLLLNPYLREASFGVPDACQV